MTSFDKDAIVLIKRSLPLLISGGLGVINTFVDKSFSTLFNPGTLTIISYSIMIVTLISSLITNAIGGASYSFIASEIEQDQLKQAQNRINKINFFFLSIFSLICLGFILIGEYFLTLIFYRGNITIEDVRVLYQLTLIFLPMTIYTSIGTIVLQTFYSFNNLKVTTLINSLSVLLHIALNVLFIDYFGYYTLAGSTLIASLTATLVNAYFLNKIYGMKTINYRILLFSTLMTLFTLSTLLLNNIWLQILIILSLIVIFILLFKKEIKGLKNLIFKFLRKERR